MLAVVAALALGGWLLMRATDAPPREAAPDAPRAVPPEPSSDRPPERRRAAVPAVGGGDVETAESARSSLVVQVVRAADGSAIAGAEVVLGGDDGEVRALTGPDGCAAFPGVGAGFHRVRAFADGHQRVVRDHEGATPLTLELEVGVAFDVLVLEDRDGSAVAGAEVVVEEGGSLDGYASITSGPPREAGRTDDDGRFRVRGVPEGELSTVVVRADGATESRVTLRPADGRVREDPLVLRLVRGGTLSGVVRDPTGAAVADATVYVVPAQSPQLRRNPRMTIVSTDGLHLEARSATTGADGSFRVTSLTLDHDYVALAEAPGLARSAEFVFRLVASRPEASADLALQVGAPLVLRLVGDGGALVTDARVRVGDFMSGFGASSADDAGTYRIRRIGAGEHVVRASAAGYVDVERAFAARAGETVELEVVLDPGALVHGVVVDPAGAAVTDVRVMATAEADGAGGSSADPDETGRFVLRGLTAGRYRVHALTVPFGRGDRPNWATQETVTVDAPAEDLRLVVRRLGSARLRLRTPDGRHVTEGVRLGRRRTDEKPPASGSHVDGDAIVLQAFDGTEETLTIAVEGFVRVERTLQVGPGEDADLGEIVLDPGFDLAGRVVDPQGRPVPGATVLHSGSTDDTTDADGAFVLHHASEGDDTLYVSADGFLDLEEEIVAERGSPPLGLTLRRGGVFTGRLRDASGQVLLDHTLSLREPPTEDGARGEWVDGTTSGADGVFMTRVAPGRYFVTWEEDDPVVEFGEITLEEGGLGGPDLVLLR